MILDTQLWKTKKFVKANFGLLERRDYAINYPGDTSISAADKRSKADELRLRFRSCESSIERCDVGRRSMEQVIFFMMEEEFLFLSLQFITSP